MKLPITRLEFDDGYEGLLMIYRVNNEPKVKICIAQEDDTLLDKYMLQITQILPQLNHLQHLGIDTRFPDEFEWEPEFLTAKPESLESLEVCFTRGLSPAFLEGLTVIDLEELYKD